MDAPPPPVISLWSADGSDAVPAGLPAALTLLPGAARDPHAALRRAATAHPGRDVLLLASDAHWPPGAWERLAAAWQSGAWDILSPLDGSELSFLAERDSRRRDEVCWSQGEHQVFPAARWSATCSLWRGTLLAGDDDLALATARTGLLPCVYIGPARPTDGEPSLAAAALQRATPLPPVSSDVTRPAVLHIMHGWGGGAERFVRDLAGADHERRHLVLVARSEHDRPPYGHHLALHGDLDAPPLQVWRLSAPIADTALASVEVDSLLRDLVGQWGIGAVLVSSLIGHSLDVLRTGLPTAWCAHDAYPFWPLLHDNRDPAREPFDQSALRTALVGAGKDWLFAERDAGRWWQLREQTLAAIARHGVRLVAPSHAARLRLCGIAPELAQAEWREVAHGLAPLEPWTPAVVRPPEAPLRVLVPGRINGGKGEALLAALVDRLPANVELVLLGGGHAAERFLGRRGVHVLKDYRRDDLPQWLATLSPDLALLPSTVPESWGYVLSEMLALRVPILCADLGAYRERLGGGGWLLGPGPAPWLEKLRELAVDRQPLAAIRATPAPSLPTLEAMAAAWREALPAQPAALRFPVAVADSVSRLALAGERDNLRQQLALRDALATSQRVELDRRAEWASELQAEGRRLAHRLDASGSALRDLRTQLDQALAHHADRHAEQESALASERARSQQLAQDKATAQEDIARLRQELAAAQEQVILLQRDLAQAQERDTALQHDRADLAARADALATRLAQAQERSETLTAELAESHRYYQRDTVDLARQRDIALAQRNDLDTRLRQVLAHPAWKLAAPLRWLVDRAQSLAVRAAYRFMLYRSLWARGRQSLRIRGWLGTWRRWQERRQSAAVAPGLRLPAAAAAVDPAGLRLPEATQPRASIIIPVYNQLPYTLACLQSLAAAGDQASFEVIVVDDGSSDDSRRALPAIPGLRYQRNARNLGFIGACNAGARQARGDFLVFLNNDTVVQPGWLDALLATFESHPDTGLAGSKLVYPDGRLQEAGGIVFADGSGWNYGRFGDPAHPDYNYVREADYCSGAAIALPRTLFERLGGFDDRYTPAYYEDTDLAMRVREAGLKVRYQPASVVVHYEGVTAGTDVAQGVKAHQVRNQQVFLERWRETLRSSHPPAGTDIRLACEYRRRHRVLVLDACTPTPDRDSGSVRMRALMRLLLEEGCALSFFPENQANDGAYTHELQQLGVAAWWQPWLGDLPRWLAEHGPRFDLVIASRHYVLAPLLPLLRQFAPQARIVFDTVDLHYLREQREAALSGDAARARAAGRTREAELGLVRSVDATWVVSPAERVLLANEAPRARVEVVSNIHDARGAGPGFEARSGLLFVGGYRHPPNVDAALWMADEVLPLIRAVLPGVELHLVGGDAPPAIAALGERPGIRFHGYLPDLLPLLDGARIAVAPLRYGAGVKGKVNQSLAHGQPVVATTCAVEGMHLVDGQDVLVADDAAAFADAVVRLYRDESLWRTLAAGGLENTRRHFSPEAARPVLRRLLDGLSPH